MLGNLIASVQDAVQAELQLIQGPSGSGHYAQVAGSWGGFGDDAIDAGALVDEPSSASLASLVAPPPRVTPPVPLVPAADADNYHAVETAPSAMASATTAPVVASGPLRPTVIRPVAPAPAGFTTRPGAGHREAVEDSPAPAAMRLTADQGMSPPPTCAPDKPRWFCETPMSDLQF